jgi:CheY-like chemotaxis protein
MNHKNILLVDDDADDQFIFKDALSEINEQVQCITASNGLEALEILNSCNPRPTLIFLDLNMPLMNGFECLEQIQEKFKEIPVVIFTTSDNPSDRRRTKEAGAKFFFTKTSDFKLLKNKIIEILDMDFSNSSS